MFIITFNNLSTLSYLPELLWEESLGKYRKLTGKGPGVDVWTLGTEEIMSGCEPMSVVIRLVARSQQSLSFGQPPSFFYLK